MAGPSEEWLMSVFPNWKPGMLDGTGQSKGIIRGGQSKLKYCFDVQQEYELFSGKDPEVFYCPVELEKLTLHRLTKERESDPQFRAVCDVDGRPLECKSKSDAYIALAAMLNEEVYEWLDIEREGERN